MIDNAPNRISPLATQSRRQEIEQQLAACGLKRGPRRLFRDQHNLDFETRPSRRLRIALESLGPIFSAFGLYLSSRVDLWPAKVCLEFARIPDHSAATSAISVGKLVEEEIKCLPEEAFSGFEAHPFESRLLFQSHNARLGGDDVIVKVIHPEAESRLSIDLELLALFKDSFAGCGLSDAAFKSASGDFCHTLKQQMDFSHQVRAFEALAQDAEGYDAVQAPRVYRSLCTSRVIVIEKPDGLKLSEIISFASRSRSNAISALPGTRGFERDELARLLCEVWLRQALLGRCFPVDPRPEDITVLPGGQITFTGGSFAGLPTEPQENLWNYLLAAESENSDNACSFLLREMKKEGTVRDDVRQRFRQAMPFRDGGWDASGDCQTLAELLFVHWRFARECGYTPRMHLPSFYRGLFNITDVARRVGPRIDSLAEGIRDLRLLTCMSGFREMMNPREVMNKYSALLINLPQHFDEALSLAAQGKLQPKLELSDAINHRRLKNSSAVTIALLLVLTALPLLQHLASSAAWSQWSRRIILATFVLLAAQVLRSVVQAR